MLNQFGIRTRLIFLLGLGVLNVVFVGGISNYYLGRVCEYYDHIVKLNVRALKGINEARNSQRDIVVLVSNIVASHGPVRDLSEVQSNFEKAKKSYEDATQDYNSIPPLEGEAQLRQDVAKAWSEFIVASKKVIDISASPKPEDLELRTSIGNGELANARKAFRKNFTLIADFHDGEMTKWSKDAENLAGLSKTVLLISLVVGCVLVLLLGISTSNSLVRALHAITDQIAKASTDAETLSQKISEASTQLARNSQDQSSSLQQTASAMEQVSSMVSNNVGNAQKTRTVSDDSKQKALEGKDAVMAMVEAIGLINQSNTDVRAQIESSNKEIREIVKVISEIETSTKVINDIVFQTKLLSFNAAVESARAGEHGKGFAVVAEEVGQLAQMSGEAAHKISEQLQQSITRVESIVARSSGQIAELLDQNKQKVEKGIEISEQCKIVLENLVENVSQMNGMAGEIVVASEEQSRGVKEVNSAVSSLDAVAQETATASNALSNAAQTLIQQTGGLNSVVSNLTQVVNGKKAA